MSRIYLIITLCLFTFLACTNSANSNDQEEADTTDNSVNLENAVGSYVTSDGVRYSVCGTAYGIDIYRLNDDTYMCRIDWAPSASRFRRLCKSNFPLYRIENGKWGGNTGWHIIVPEDGFPQDLSSIVLAYEDSTGIEFSYPFDKVK